MCVQQCLLCQFDSGSTNDCWPIQLSPNREKRVWISQDGLKWLDPRWCGLSNDLYRLYCRSHMTSQGGETGGQLPAAWAAPKGSAFCARYVPLSEAPVCLCSLASRDLRYDIGGTRVLNRHGPGSQIEKERGRGDARDCTRSDQEFAYHTAIIWNSGTGEPKPRVQMEI